MPVMAPTLFSRVLRVFAVQGSHFEIRVPCVMYSERRKIGRFNHDSFQFRCSSLFPGGIPSLKRFSAQVRSGALKALSANASERNVICEQSKRHCSEGISGMP